MNRRFTRDRWHLLVLLATVVPLSSSCMEDPVQPASREIPDSQVRGPSPTSRMTRVAIEGDDFLINGAILYPGTAAEGRLMNVRMVNAVFEDRRRDDFDPAQNTDEFVERMAEYFALGIRAFTLSLQGGYPGYEGALNSAFRLDGDLRPSYLARVARVIEEADALGAIIILSLFYQRQDQRLEDREAVRSSVINVVKWIQEQGYTNVILEIANEYGHRGFDHSVLDSDRGVASLIRLVKQRAPDLLVSASSIANGQATPQVADASDLVLTHFNSTPLEDIPSSIQELRGAYPSKPIVCNEDARTGESAARAAQLAVKNGASYGLMLQRENQHYPFEFQGRMDDPVAYDMIASLTSDPVRASARTE